MFVGKAVSEIAASSVAMPTYGVVTDLDGENPVAVVNYTLEDAPVGSIVIFDRLEDCRPGGHKFVLIDFVAPA